MPEIGRGASSGEVPERFDPGSENPSLMRAEHWARYRLAAQLSEGKRVLDAGCGTGYGTALLASAGAAEVTAVDMSPAALKGAAERCPGARLVEADLTDTQLATGEFDLISCFEVIEHIEEQEALVAELARLLAPEGVLLVSSPNPGVYPAGNPHHVRELSPNELSSRLGPHFENIALMRQHPWVASAILETGLFESADQERYESSVLVKVDAAPAGSETYALAIASNAPLPAVMPVTTLAEPDDLRDYALAVKALESRVLDAENATRAADERRKAADREAERAEARGHAAEEELRTTTDHLARANTAIADMTTSVSWRITAPLRKLRRKSRRA